MLKIEKELEQKLNEYWKAYEECGQEFYTFEVKECKDDVIVNCFNDDKTDAWTIKTKYSSDMAAMIKNCINEFYETMINPYSRIVTSWKGFVNRKVKSLSLAMGKNDSDKINKINEDMIEQYKRMTIAKFQVDENKVFINMFYIIKEEYEPIETKGAM